MKSILAVMALIVFCLNAQSATWTFHGCKDNYSAVTWSSTPGYYWTMSWDWWNDLFYKLDSGTRTIAPGNDTGYSGYSESLTMEIPDNTPFITCMCTGGYPDYNGNWENVTFPTFPGEYWLDMDSTGTPRLSNSQPLDFGKWAWDGSINPSWVEPLVQSSPGKRLAKGHSKYAP